MADAAPPPPPTKAYRARDTFGRLGIKYEHAFKGARAQERSLAWLISRLAAGAHVVDVGSGTGRPACGALVDAGLDLDVLGIDITPEMVDVARANVPNARFELADARAWEPQASALPLDAVVSYFAFLADVTVADIHAFFRRAYAWLGPGGCFVFGTVPLPHGDGDVEMTPITWMGMDGIVVSSLSERGVLDGIVAAGFVVDEVETDLFLPQTEAAGICGQDDAEEEPHLCVCARKPTSP